MPAPDFKKKKYDGKPRSTEYSMDNDEHPRYFVWNEEKNIVIKVSRDHWKNENGEGYTISMHRGWYAKDEKGEQIWKPRSGSKAFTLPPSEDTDILTEFMSVYWDKHFPDEKK